MIIVKGKEHLVVKRDGRLESYNENKMRKVLEWAINKAQEKIFGNINEQITINMINEVLQDTKVKIYDKIHISKLFDAVIETCESKICELQPIWDEVTKNLLIQKFYKETWGIKRNEYPDYLEVIKKGKSVLNSYKKIYDNLSEDEIIELGKYIKPERDFYFTSLGLKNMMHKYSLKYSKRKNLELPQHVFMRLAIKSFINEPKDKRLSLIKERYDYLSNSIFSEATPRFNDNNMEASCVLMQMGDDSWSILRTIQSTGLYSKHGGGTAVDVSNIRCIGSKIGSSNESDGVIPFIKMIEATISGFKQGNIRRGACAIYFNWWHYEVEDLVMLKDEGGNEDKRARKLQYAIKLNKFFLERVLENTKNIDENDKIIILTDNGEKEIQAKDIKKYAVNNKIKVKVKTLSRDYKYVEAIIED